MKGQKMVRYELTFMVPHTVRADFSEEYYREKYGDKFKDRIKSSLADMASEGPFSQISYQRALSGELKRGDTREI